MSNGESTVEGVKALLRSCIGFDSQQIRNFYDSWCDEYEKGFGMLDYMAPKLGVSFLDANFSGSREDAQVLDVACGSGLVTKLMSEVGFKNIVGVDCSKGMLGLAAQTGLYQDLRLALLGTQPLPALKDSFDVVILVGALDAGFIPVSVVRELCHATKPGGLVCLVRGHHRGASSEGYKSELQTELQLMEEEGLWSLLGTNHTNRYMKDTQRGPDGDQQGELFIPGTVYLYRKSL